MNKLDTELHRLYFLPGHQWSSLKPATANPVIDLITSTGLLRCFILSIGNGRNWAQVAALYQGVQDDLDLPAPAIAVSVEEGYQIWFSLAEPIAWQLAKTFMEGLRRKYLSETKIENLKFRPELAGDLKFVPQVPAKQATTERWSAYIDPTMGSMFIEETWLEMAPGLDKQAGMLAGLKSIKAENFDRALSILRTINETETGSAEPHLIPENAENSLPQPSSKAAPLGVGSGFSNPKSFLLAVMNEPTASGEQRMAAAIALLPYFENGSENE